MRRPPAPVPTHARLRRLARPLRAAVLAAAIPGAVVEMTATTATGMSAAVCVAGQLSVKMTLTPGSGAAGHIGYTLAVRNRGGVACRMGNHPQLKLLRANGHGLPTHVVKLGAAKVVTIAAGKTVRSSLQFSPDVASGSEPTTGPCEPLAHKVRVTFTAPSGGSRTGPVSPPTRVCGQGTIEEKPLA
jgi:hypothetical protein